MRGQDRQEEHNRKRERENVNPVEEEGLLYTMEKREKIELGDNKVNIPEVGETSRNCSQLYK